MITDITEYVAIGDDNVIDYTGCRVQTRIQALSNVGAFYDFGVDSSFEKELSLLGFSVRFNKTEIVREFKERVRKNQTMPEEFNFVDIIFRLCCKIRYYRRFWFFK